MSEPLTDKQLEQIRERLCDTVYRQRFSHKDVWALLATVDALKAEREASHAVACIETANENASLREKLAEAEANLAESNLMLLNRPLHCSCCAFSQAEVADLRADLSRERESVAIAHRFADRERERAEAAEESAKNWHTIADERSKALIETMERAERAERERDDWRQASYTHNETIGILHERLKTQRHQERQRAAGIIQEFVMSGPRVSYIDDLRSIKAAILEGQPQGEGPAEKPSSNPNVFDVGPRCQFTKSVPATNGLTGGYIGHMDWKCLKLMPCRDHPAPQSSEPQACMWNECGDLACDDHDPCQRVDKHTHPEPQGEKPAGCAICGWKTCPHTSERISELEAQLAAANKDKTFMEKQFALCCKNSDLKSARLATQEKALEALVWKLDIVHGDLRYQAVWQIAQAHVGPYKGPQYEKELEAARAALRPEVGKP